MTKANTCAWIFLSIPPSPVGLRDLIAMADGLNKAIPTHQELQMSLGWLQAHGLIQKTGNEYFRTKAGSELQAGISTKDLFEMWDLIAARFAKMVGPATPLDDISESDVATAYKDYQTYFESLLSAKKKH